VALPLSAGGLVVWLPSIGFLRSGRIREALEDVQALSTAALIGRKLIAHRFELA